MKTGTNFISIQGNAAYLFCSVPRIEINDMTYFIIYLDSNAELSFPTKNIPSINWQRPVLFTSGKIIIDGMSI